MKHSFGRRLREFRLKRKKSLANLALDLGCSAPKLYKLEHDKFSKQIPAHFVQQVCDALTLTDVEIAELFEVAGYTPPSPDVERVVSVVRETLQDREFSDLADELIAEVRSCVNRWRTSQRARRQRVGKVIVAAAGWQPRLLALDRFERTLLPAIHEAARAGISEILLIVPPNIPSFQVLQRTFRSSTIRPVVQHEALGLGNALLTAKEHVENEPFAVLLADEIDESGTALRDLIKAYDQVHKPLVAVDTYDAQGDAQILRYFGFASLGEQVQQHIFSIRDQLIEKPINLPGSDHLRIAGRYILTPEILRALQNTERDRSGQVKHDLTAAINQVLVASASVLAYKLRQNMFSFAPYRNLVDNMDKREAFDPFRYQRTRRAHGNRKRDG